MFGRVIIVNNEGTIIFGNVAVIKINETSVSTEGTDSSNTSEFEQIEENASASGIVTSNRSKRNRFKPR
jgi:hypothetical protein